ncbi:MAG: FAD-dependent monooxygenase [Gammaproteobacteria bacterium]|nr:FAD-dependent monooxygenase [Gammaproteobacteria bacterium]
MNQHTPSITLIGAGLVGSLTALLLAQRGFRVSVYERRPDMRKADISAGRSINLALANRGIFPLQQAGIMDQVEPLLTAMKGRMIHDKQGNCHLQPYGQKSEEVIFSVSRADLNILCLNEAEKTGLVEFHFEHKCVAVDIDKREMQIEHHEKNSTIGFNQIVGTDGSASAVREAIHAKTSDYHRIEPLGHSYKELTIPSAPNGQFQMEPNALHIWPRGGYMVIALPNRDGSFTVTLFMPNEGEVSFASINNAESLMAFFEREFPDTLALIPDLTTSFFANPTGHLATVRAKPWHYQDSALLLGDAAHAIVPFHGQGMNCGFEDALEFVQQIDRNPNNWSEIFQGTELNRFANGNAIADMAIENYIEMRDSVNDPIFVLKKQLSFELEKRFPERFIPRYSMVMFHRLPYSEAQQRGKIQSDILEQLIAGKKDLHSIDYALAAQLIEQKLPVFN